MYIAKIHDSYIVLGKDIEVSKATFFPAMFSF